MTHNAPDPPAPLWSEYAHRPAELVATPALALDFIARANSEGYHGVAVEIGESCLPHFDEAGVTSGDFVREYARALAIRGSRERALELLEGHLGEDSGATYIFGLIGRIYKDLAADPSADGEQVATLRERALDFYSRGHENARRHDDDGGAGFTAVNAAYLALLLRRDDTKTEMARAAAELAKGDDYYSVATRAEASLLLGDVEAARELYTRATDIALAGDRLSDLASTRRQCRAIAMGMLGRRDALDDCFGKTSVAVLATQPGKENLPGDAVERVLAWAKEEGVRAVYADASSSAESHLLRDLAAAEIDVHLIRPTGSPAVLEELLTIARSCSESPGCTFADGYLITSVAAQAALLARDLDVKVQPLWVGDIEASRTLTIWQKHFGQCHLIHPDDSALDGQVKAGDSGQARPFPQALSPRRAEVQACFLLQVHFPAYQTLDDAGFVHFQDTVLPEMADCLAKSAHRPLSRAGFGGEYALIYQSSEEAAEAARELRTALADVMEEPHAPAFCLHAGAATLSVNPVLNYYAYEGSLMAAVIDLARSLPAGQTYATGEFVAFTALHVLHGLRFEPAGRMEDCPADTRLFQLQTS